MLTNNLVGAKKESIRSSTNENFESYFEINFTFYIKSTNQFIYRRTNERSNEGFILLSVIDFLVDDIIFNEFKITFLIYCN